MSVYLLDPVRDPRWADFIEQHPRASVFHSAGWMEALRRTYGYHPLVLTTSKPDTQLTFGLPVCIVKGWIRPRAVSLPFSDHCEPLVDRAENLDEILSFLAQAAATRRWRYVELRPRHLACPSEAAGRDFHVARTYCLHALDLRPSLGDLSRRLHRSCIHRPVRRAEREELEYEAGSSASLVARFYGLLQLTRRRHGLPPQPLAWFRNLVTYMGKRLTIRMASKKGRPVAGVLTLAFKKTLVYKYGGSDASCHRLGGMPFLFWRIIQEAKEQAFEELDLGRTDPGNAGLVAFKNHLGANGSTLTYYRHPKTAAWAAEGTWKLRAAQQVFAHLPTPALTIAGRLLYRHLG